MKPLDVQRDSLSTEGQKRRDRILLLAEASLERRVRRRNRQRTIGMSAVILLAGAGLYWGFQGQPGSAPPSQSPSPVAIDTPAPSDRDPIESTETASPPPGRTPLKVAVVRDDPQVLERLTAHSDQSRVVRVGDDELLDLLHTAGRNEGLIRTDGRVFLSSEASLIAQAARHGRVSRDHDDW